MIRTRMPPLIGSSEAANNSFRAEDEFDRISGLGRRPLGLCP